MTSSRRSLLAFALAAALPHVARAAPRVIGWLTPYSRESAQLTIAPVVKQLEARGYAVGADIVLEPRYADSRSEQIAPLARELVALRPALIVTTGSNAPVEALLKITRSIPIVMHGSAAPAELGLVRSLNKPGGNVTGTTYAQREIAGKGLEVLNAAAPRARRISVAWNPDWPGMKLYRALADPVASRLGLTIADVHVRSNTESPIAAIERTKPEALYVAVDPVMAAHYRALIEFANTRRLPSLGTHVSFAHAGGLLSTSYDPMEMVQNVADCIDRILRGADPGDIPVREPSRYVITLNRKTADAIGVAPSRDLMLMVNEVIDP